MGKANLPYFGRAVGKANLGRNLSGQGKFALFRLGRNLSGQGKCALFWVGRAGTLVGKANLPYFGRAVGKANLGRNLSGQGKFTLFGLGWNFSGQGQFALFWVGRAGTLVGKANLPYFGRAVGKANEWPSVLVLTRKRWRWRGAVVMLDHEVACNRTLDLDGVTYKLVSVATHIGASPTEGHYVAYRNMNGNFVRLDDQVVTAAYTAPERAFAMTPKEKAYMLVYIRDDRRELPPNKFRRLTANRTMVLDISEASDDSASDVIVEEDKDRGLRMNSSENVVIQHEDRDEDTEMKTFEATSEMAAPARDAYVGFTPEEEAAIEAAFAEVPSPDALVEPEPAKNPGRRPLSKFAPVERAAIESAIKEAGNVKLDVATLAATVPRLSVQDRNAPTYLSPSTIRNWVQNHTKLDRALALANTTRTRAAVETSANPGSDAPQQPPEAAAATRRAQATVKRRVHPVGSTKHKLPEAAAAVVDEALKRTNSVAALTSILEETLPGFSTSNADAPVYVARSTLRNWLARGTPTTSFGSVRDGVLAAGGHANLRSGSRATATMASGDRAQHGRGRVATARVLDFLFTLRSQTASQQRGEPQVPNPGRQLQTRL